MRTIFKVLVVNSLIKEIGKMLTSEEILQKIEENKGKIRKFGVRRIGLFGSYIKGMKTFDNYMELKFFLEDLFNCKVDLVIAEALKPDLKSHVLRSVKYATRV